MALELVNLIWCAENGSLFITKGILMPKNKANKRISTKEKKRLYLIQRRYSKKQQINLYKFKYDCLFLFENRCLSCGSQENLQLDHIKPVSKYPELTFNPSNFQILCRKCNSKKSNTQEIDFRDNLKKKELWSKLQKKAFRELINKNKIHNPIKYSRALTYKHSFEDYNNGIRDPKPRKRISEKRYNYLMSLDYTLEDVIYNRRKILSKFFPDL